MNELEQEKSSVFPAGPTALRRLREHDPELGKVGGYIRYGWPVRLDRNSSLYSYWLRREELSISEGIVLWGMRVLIPAAGRSGVLHELHSGHLGGARMKSIARSHVW